MYLIINKWVITVKVSKFSGQYLHKHRTLDIGVLVYIVIVWPKEHSPEVRSFPPGTSCILLRIKEQRNILHEISKRKANWIGHILCRNCLLQRVIEGKIKGEIEVTGRRGRRRRKLLDDLKERKGYSHLIALCGELALEEALDLS